MASIIRLPTLVQKIKIDTTDMRRAEKLNEAWGKKFVQQSRDMETALNNLRDSQRDFAAESRRTSTTVGQSNRDFDRSTRTMRDRDRQMRNSTRNTNNFAGSVRRLHDEDAKILRKGKSFLDTTVRTGIRIPIVAAKVVIAATAISAAFAGSAAAIAQFTPGIVGAGAAVVAFAGNVAPAVGVLGALPAGFLAFKSGSAVFKAVTKDATEAAAVIRETGTRSKESKEALAKLSPPARKFAIELGILGHNFDEMNDAAQARALPGFTRALQNSRKLLPIIDRGFQGIAGALGNIAEQASKELTKGPFAAKLGLIVDRNTELITTMGKALVPLIDGFANLVIAAGPMTKLLANDAVALANWFRAATSKNATKLTQFFLDARDVAGKLGATVVNVGKWLWRVAEIGAKAWGTDFAGSMKNATQRWVDFANSVEGRKKIFDFFKKAKEDFISLKNTIRDLGVGIYNVFKIAGKSIGIDFAGGLEDAAKKFRAFTESDEGIQKISDFFAKVGPVVKEVGNLFWDVTKAFVGLGDNADLAPVIKMIRTDLLPMAVDFATAMGEKLGPALVTITQFGITVAKLIGDSPLIPAISKLAEAGMWFLDFVTGIPGLGPVISDLLGVAAGIGGIYLAVKSYRNIKGFARMLGLVGLGFGGFSKGVKGSTTAIAGELPMDRRKTAAMTTMGTTTRKTTSRFGKFGNAIRSSTRRLGPATVGVATLGSTIDRSLGKNVPAVSKATTNLGRVIDRSMGKEMPAAVAKGGGSFSKLGPTIAKGGKSALRVVGKGGPVGILGFIAADAIAAGVQDGQGGVRDAVGGAISNAATGAATGALIGSVVPGVGTAIGAAIGAGLGLAADENVQGGVKNFFKGLFGGSGMEDGESQARDAGKKIRDSFIKDFWEPVIEKPAKATGSWFKEVGTSFKDDFLKPVFVDAPKAVGGWGKQVGQSFMNDFVDPVFIKTPQAIAGAVSNFATTTATGFAAAGQGIADGVMGAWNGATGALGTVKDGITGWFTDRKNEVTSGASAVGSAFGTIGGWASSAWTNAGAPALSWINGQISSALSSGASLAATGAKSIGDKAKDIGGWFKNGWNEASRKFSEVKTSISGWMGNILSTITSSNIVQSFVNAGKNLGSKIAEGISAAKGLVASAASGLAKTARDYWPFSPAKAGPLKKDPPEKAGQNIGRMLADGIRSSTPTVAASAGALVAHLSGLTAQVGLGTRPGLPVASTGRTGAPAGPAGPVSNANSYTFIFNEAGKRSSRQSMIAAIRDVELSGPALAARSV